MSATILKKLKMALAVGTTAAMLACSHSGETRNLVTWETLGNTVDEEGNKVYTQRFTVSYDQDYDGLAFCMFKRGMQTVDPADTLIEILPGYFLIKSPRFENAKPGEPVTVDILTSGTFRNISYAPDGFHLVANGNPIRIDSELKPITAFPEQWLTPGSDVDQMIYGEEIFALNDSLRSNWTPSAYSQIPTPKSVILKEERFEPTEIVVRPIKSSHNDYWKASITPDSIVLYTNSNYPYAMKTALERRINESMDKNGLIQAAEIEDWSDYPYRGFMLDVARNFLPTDAVKKVIDIMSRYGLNVLHFHLGDDEGWRIETPSLPELTEVGARRGYTLTDDVPFLKGIYSGDGNPDATDTPANGFYTVDDYIEILKYADAKGISVIPEFDTPGHSRAAIRAMEHRYKTTGNATTRLIHDGDTSKYTTAQDLHDNIMNPALDGPYKFMSIVFDDIIAIYKKAGVPLQAIHIGGDEVPEGAWDGSEYARELMKEKGFKHQRELHGYFNQKVAEIAAQKGVKIAGWQEIALDHSPEYDRNLIPVLDAVNSWTKSGPKGLQMAQKGYPIILSNVDYLYFDQTSTTNPEEKGLTWGGLVDEFTPLHATIDELIPADEKTQKAVKGISATLFSETVRDLPMVERYMLPRILGLAERAHNARPTLSDEEYFGIVTAEIPKWVAENTNFYLRQPGIKVNNDGKVEMNTAYGTGEIRYTLDGSQPSANSPLYTEPFDANGASEIRARLYLGPAVSSTTILYNK